MTEISKEIGTKWKALSEGAAPNPNPELRVLRAPCAETCATAAAGTGVLAGDKLNALNWASRPACIRWLG